uniref:F-box domain-containing protein n=1 Tax=Triticum aestivum TaxID=4565 RepID=A0A077S4H0_WHEAT|nr:unnamed protein product [Triticum aestivum]
MGKAWACGVKALGGARRGGPGVVRRWRGARRPGAALAVGRRDEASAMWSCTAAEGWQGADARAAFSRRALGGASLGARWRRLLLESFCQPSHHSSIDEKARRSDPVASREEIEMRDPEAPSLMRLPEILARVPGVADLFRCAAARKRWRDLVIEPSFLTPLAGGRVPLLLPCRLPRPGAAPWRGRAAGLQLRPRGGGGGGSVLGPSHPLLSSFVLGAADPRAWLTGGRRAPLAISAAVVLTGGPALSDLLLKRLNLSSSELGSFLSRNQH